MRKIFPCQKNIFKDVLLVVIYHYPFYETIPLVKSNYGGSFPHMVVCGSEASTSYDIMVVEHYMGYFGYECLGKAMRLHPGFRGYLYVNDDMIVNWWNFVRLDKDKVWLGAPINYQAGFKINTRPIPKEWAGGRITSEGGHTGEAERCEAAILDIVSRSKISSDMARCISIHHRNSLNMTLCVRAWSDLFYVPGSRAKIFQELSAIFFKHKVFLSNGVTTALSMLDPYDNWEKPYGVYLPDIYSGKQLRDGQIGWKKYSASDYFVHPVKFKSNVGNRNMLKERVIASSKSRTRC